VRVFEVDAIELPSRRTDFADDLDGDGRPDDQLGNLVGLAESGGYRPSESSQAMLSSGALAPRLALIGEGDRAALLWRSAPDDPGARLDGRFDAGRFRSPSLRCQPLSVRARVFLPIFPDADPVELPIDGASIELAPDGAGVRGILRGAVPADAALLATWRAIASMVRARPVEHRALLRLLDGNHDGTIALDELRANPLLGRLVAPDLRTRGPRGEWSPSPPRPDRPPDALSLAFAFHARPCPDGVCPSKTPTHASCGDRVRDGDERDVDCGGSCPACPGGARCAGDRDCQSGACRDGRCDEIGCSDRRRDGAESDLDCGGSCLPCKGGRACRDDEDCRGLCRAGRCAPCRRDADCRGLGRGRGRCEHGACGPASCHDGRRDGDESDVDCGGSCPRCPPGRACRDEGDCARGECEHGRCQSDEAR